MDRVNYYQGRDASAQVAETFREALGKYRLSKKPGFIEWFEGFYDYSLRTDKEIEQLKSQYSQILLDEFNRAPVDSELAFEIVKAASEEGFELGKFKEAVLMRRVTSCTALLAKRPEWDGEVKYLVVDVLEDERLPAEQKNFYLAELEKLSSRGPLKRKMILEDAFKGLGENARRIPLLLGYPAGSAGQPEKRRVGRRRRHIFVGRLYSDGQLAGGGKADASKNSPSLLPTGAIISSRWRSALAARTRRKMPCESG